ncbi:MAG: 4-hydroxy-tetrahydrodipicolinate reductase [Alphaproteobacteria bacterium]|nr:4-hydroxy-tetrahydrodipicolinate reductase [Alphaproteobacteria bacterium]
MTIRIGIAGFAGRMGQAIALATQQHAEAALVGGVDRAITPELKAQYGKLIVTERAEELFPSCDVIVDFSAPSATAGFAKLAATHGKAFMSGTTGLDDAAKAALKEAAQKVPVLYTTNTSLSLVVMKQLAKMAAHLLRDQDYDVSILDQHHRMKKDAPSGTAKTLGEYVVEGNGGKHEPQYAAIRAGFIVGEHEVQFSGQGEIITLKHSVTDRGVFARGAVQAAVWLHGKTPGLYGMDDVLGVG